MSNLQLEKPTVGGIPEPDYFRWVQRSLERAFRNARLPILVDVNGRDSAGLRDAIRRFKALVRLEPADTRIDIPTQDSLIKANQADRGYMRWVQSQLNALGAGSLTVTGKYDKATIAAIRSFQAYHDGRFGFALVDDGFIGAKTELALRLAIHKPPEPHRPKPRPPTVVTDDQLHYQLVKAEDWLGEFADRDRYPTEWCVIAKLKDPKTDDGYWDAMAIHTFMMKPLRSGSELQARSARKRLKVFLKARWDTGRVVTPESVVRTITDIVGDMTDGIRALQISYCNDPRLPAVQRQVQDAAKRRYSLYSCPVLKARTEKMKRCVG